MIHDTLTHPRSHPRPRLGDTARFTCTKEKGGGTFSGEIFLDQTNRVLLGFNNPKIGVKNGNEEIPYRRIVVLGEGGIIKSPVLWFDVDDFKLAERNGEKIYYPGDDVYVEAFDRVFRVAEVIGDAIVCCAGGMCLTFLQPSLATSHAELPVYNLPPGDLEQ